MYIDSHKCIRVILYVVDTNTSISHPLCTVYTGSVSHSINSLTCTDNPIHRGSQTTDSYSHSQVSSDVHLSPFSSDSTSAYPTSLPPYCFSYKSPSSFLVSGSHYTSAVVNQSVNISNSVQVVSSTGVILSPQQTMCGVSPPTDNVCMQDTSSTCQSKVTGSLGYTLSSRPLDTLNKVSNLQNISQYTQSDILQTHPTSILQNTVCHGRTSQQPFKTGSVKRTHSRGQSHGHLCLNPQPTMHASGRTSLPHISLDVSPSDDDINDCHAPLASDSVTPITIKERQWGLYQDPVQRSLYVHSKHGFDSSIVTHSQQPASKQLSSSPMAVSSSLHHSVSSFNSSFDRHVPVSYSSVDFVQCSNKLVSLQPPIITTPRVQTPCSPTEISPFLIETLNSDTCTRETHQQSKEAPSVVCSTTTATNSSIKIKTMYRRGHVRNHSFGNDIPQKGQLFYKRHTRNRSVGSIPGPSHSQRTMSSRRPSLGNLSITSGSSFLSNVSYCMCF